MEKEKIYIELVVVNEFDILFFWICTRNKRKRSLFYYDSSVVIVAGAAAGALLSVAQASASFPLL